MSVNDRIVEWVKKQELARKSVGAGECWDLAEQAVTQAGGKSSKDLTPDFSETADYVWGASIALGDVKPGDILQFSNYRWDTKTSVSEEGSDGSSKWSEKSATQSRSHHTAVVVAVLGDGSVRVVEQNVKGNRTAHGNVLRLTDITRPDTVTEKTVGKVKYKVTTTVTETVAGSVRAYRATAKAAEK